MLPQNRKSLNEATFDYLTRGLTKGDNRSREAGSPGTPTADQEALQQPVVDPIYLLAGGLIGGPQALSTGLFTQLLLNRHPNLSGPLSLPGTGPFSSMMLKAAQGAGSTW